MHVRRAPAPRPLPGQHASCALLTLLTILLAWPDPPAAVATFTLPAYFALLAWFFGRAARQHRALEGLPMRLVRTGFLLLFLAFAAGAVVRAFALERGSPLFLYLLYACEHGAFFLLGITLVAYGMMLWIPRVVAAHAVLADDLVHRTTELREVEHRLLEADRRGLIGELAAGIAHDLRNPLTIVLATAESLCRKPRTAAEIAEHTDVIRRNVHKANETLTTLLDIGRPQSSRPEHLRARAIVDEVLALVHVEARRRDVRFAVNAAPGSDPMLWADRALVSQALLNLVLNAMHASAPAHTVAIRLRRSGDATVLAVEDRGSGVPAPVRMDGFVPFLTTKAHGTGLGLWSCRRIAEQQSGRLALYPRHRGGARVALRLPACPTQATRAAETETTTRRHACQTAGS